MEITRQRERRFTFWRKNKRKEEKKTRDVVEQRSELAYQVGKNNVLFVGRSLENVSRITSGMDTYRTKLIARDNARERKRI